MNDPTLLNPLMNPILIDVIIRVLITLIAGFFLIILLNNFSTKHLFKKNIGKRYLSWLIIIPIYLFAIFFGGVLAIAVLLILFVLAIWEFAKITGIDKKHVYTLLLLGLISVYVSSFQVQYFYSLPLIYFLFITMIAIKQNSSEKSFFESSSTLFFSIWILFSLSHLVLLGHLNNELDIVLFGEQTKSLLLFLGFAVALSDVFAYVFGNFFKKIGFLSQYTIASNLSPNKTYIGVLGNIFGAFIGIYLMHFVLSAYLPIYHWIIIGVLIGVVGVIGDITESMFKRSFGVKDSGDIIPGHGGVLDRIDSFTRVLVVVYYYLLFFV